jgi:hypothetical protein
MQTVTLQRHTARKRCRINSHAGAWELGYNQKKRKLNQKPMLPTHQHLSLITAVNAKALISICLLVLLYGMSANAGATENGATAPTSSLVVNVKDKGAKG